MGLALGSCSLKESLPPLFSSGADFSGMEETGTLFIGEVLHKTFIAVDKKRTEAAAARAIPFVATGPGEVLVDRPFVFLIGDPMTRTILFLGQVVDPRG